MDVLENVSVIVTEAPRQPTCTGPSFNVEPPIRPPLLLSTTCSVCVIVSTPRFRPGSTTPIVEMIQIASFPRSLALTRLKSNLFFLFLALFFQHIFTPYRTIRHGLIWLLDERLDMHMAAEAVSWAGAGLFLPLSRDESTASSGLIIAERGVLLLLGVNVLHAAWSLHSPPPAGKITVGRTVTPSKPSSPLVSTCAITPAR